MEDMLLLGGHILCMMNALGLFLKGVMKRQKNYSALICFSYLCPKYIFPSTKLLVVSFNKSVSRRQNAAQGMLVNTWR